MECKTPFNHRPKKVSFSFKVKAKLTNSIPIQYPGQRKRKFTVCYSALHSHFNQTSGLVQSIDFMTVLGAEHFMVYNFSISKHTDAILRHYQKRGILTVLQWPLPTLESWYLGQVTILNDCLFRNRNVSEFVVFLDTDELIIPRLHSSWWDMIQAIENSSYSSSKNPFLDDSSNYSVHHDAQTHSKTHKQTNVTDFNADHNKKKPSENSKSVLGRQGKMLNNNIKTKSDPNRENSSEKVNSTSILHGQRKILSIKSGLEDDSALILKPKTKTQNPKVLSSDNNVNNGVKTKIINNDKRTNNNSYEHQLSDNGDKTGNDNAQTIHIDSKTILNDGKKTNTNGNGDKTAEYDGKRIMVENSRVARESTAAKKTPKSILNKGNSYFSITFSLYFILNIFCFIYLFFIFVSPLFLNKRN